MGDRDEAFERLLEQSSLGSAGARRLRERIPRSQVRNVLRLASGASPLAAVPQDAGPLASSGGRATPRRLADPPLDRADADRMAGALKALADPVRLRILSFIGSAPGCEACVCDLAVPLGLSQPTVSHHLRILTEFGFLQREKRGVWAFYRTDPAAIGAIADFLASGASPGVAMDQETGVSG